MRVFTKCIAVVLILAFIGCAGGNAKPVVVESCGDPAGSIVNKFVADPLTADMLLVLANFEGLDRGAYTKAQAEKFFSDIESMLDGAKSYADVALYVTMKTEWLRDRLDARLILVSGYATGFLNQAIPIMPYDLCLMKTHIQNQRSKTLSLFE